MAATGFGGFIDAARELMTVRRVYGEPYEKDGLTVIPAAVVRGGVGGGGGGRGDDQSGSGGGLGLIARPCGAWIIKDGKAAWKPAVDANRIVLGGQVVGLAAILVTGRVVLALSRRERRRRVLPLARTRPRLPLRRRRSHVPGAAARRLVPR